MYGTKISLLLSNRMCCCCTTHVGVPSVYVCLICIFYLHSSSEPSTVLCLPGTPQLLVLSSAGSAYHISWSNAVVDFVGGSAASSPAALLVS